MAALTWRFFVFVFISNVGIHGCHEYQGQMEFVPIEMITEILKRLEEKDNQINALNNKIETMTTEIEMNKIKYETDIERLNETVTSLKKQMKMMTSHTSENNTTTLVHGKKPKTGRRQINLEEEQIAFSVLLSNHIEHSGINQHVVFDNVITNEANAYIQHLGAFICPSPGVYVFSVTVVSHLGHNTHFEINKNGATMSRMYVRSSESVVDTSSQTIILQLDTGDTVTIRNDDSDEALLGGNYSIFSGFKLN